MKFLPSTRMNMKRTSFVLLLLLYAVLLTAQSHYDYMDDSAVAGGADRALNGIVIIVLLLIGAFVLLLIGAGYYKIKYWLNPEESPEYKAAQKRKEIEEQRLKDRRIEEQKQAVIQAEKKKEKKAIDLGLSVMWADSNLYDDIDLGKGAKYSGGDIEKRAIFRYVDSKLNKKSKYDLNKILGNEDLSICGNDKYDAARHLWGDNWRLPLRQEIEELINLCEWEWTTLNGISGYKVIGKNGNFIFLPVTGEFISDKSNSPQAGYYWSGSANSDILGEEAHFLYFDESQKAQKPNGIRWHGMAIRPVWSPNNEVIEKDGFTMSLYGTKLIKCNAIEDCHIPNGVKIITSKAFKDAKDIKHLYIPNSVEEIEDMAFSDLHIESVYIPKSIKKWGQYVFFGCEQLKTVHIEEGLNRLGICQFYYCESLENITIPQSITRLPNDLFNGCTSLKHIELPSNLIEIGDSAFYNCESLESIELPNTLTGLQSNTFNGCYSLSNLIIPEGVVAISSCCFMNCELKKIKIPSSIQHIDADAFEGCYDLKIEAPQNTLINFDELNLDGDYEIKYYESSIPNNSEELKSKCDEYLKIQNYKREQEEYEFRKEMGIMTKDDYEEEQLFGMMDEIDRY